MLSVVIAATARVAHFSFIGDDTKLGNCPVRDEPADLRPDPNEADVWRFVTHTRAYVNSKGKLERAIDCPGSRKTYEEGFRAKRTWTLRASHSPKPITRQSDSLPHSRTASGVSNPSTRAKCNE
jgi:hypothetical protein